MERALSSVVWGTEIQRDVFLRWNQGFEFSKEEPLALIQHSGGPCAVLSPVQAFIIQKRLFEDFQSDNLEIENWRGCTDYIAQQLLLRVLAHILFQASSDGCCTVVSLKEKDLNHSQPQIDTTTRGNQQMESSMPVLEKGDTASVTGYKRKHGVMMEDEETGRKGLRSGSTPDQPTGLLLQSTLDSLSRRAAETSHRSQENKITAEQLSAALSSIIRPGQGSPTSSTTCSHKGVALPQLSSVKQLTVSPARDTTPLTVVKESTPHHATRSSPSTPKRRVSDPCAQLHLNLKSTELRGDVAVIIGHLRDNMADLLGPYGVLLFLYSVVLTKGVDRLLEEREETEQPLIDPVHGHGSQSLVNLLLVGLAITNVFDLDKDLGGIKLRGVPHQSTVGFMTILEALRYCEVGKFLKNPVYPVWLVGSETHLTVLFSTERAVASPEDTQSVAKREFNKFDPEESGMIPSDCFTDLLRALHLENDTDYVQFMLSKLDTDCTGVILLSDFLDEFFPYQFEIDPPKVFPLYHYNGLRQSSGTNVMFRQGSAVLLGEEGGTTTETTLLNCLHTKWPGLVVEWPENIEPRII